MVDMRGGGSMFERIEVASPSRSWTTALAFLVNSMVLSVAILMPLLKPDQLPTLSFRAVSLPISLPFTHHEEVATASAAFHSRENTDSRDNVFRAPSSTPRFIDMSADTTPENSGPYTGPIVGQTNLPGLPLMASSNPPPLAVVPKPARPKTLVVSHLDEGMLIRRVQPSYPRVAKLAGVQGTVVLSALISPSGEIEGLQVLSGSPLLVQSAIEAVRQWRYRPYILNGSPIEVQTRVTVNFSLQ
jgi:periplasmic protein TonB